MDELLEAGCPFACHHGRGAGQLAQTGEWQPLLHGLLGLHRVELVHGLQVVRANGDVIVVVDD